jgi:hypothetical protein
MLHFQVLIFHLLAIARKKKLFQKKIFYNSNKFNKISKLLKIY